MHTHVTCTCMYTHSGPRVVSGLRMVVRTANGGLGCELWSGYRSWHGYRRVRIGICMRTKKGLQAVVRTASSGLSKKYRLRTNCAQMTRRKSDTSVALISNCPEIVLEDVVCDDALLCVRVDHLTSDVPFVFAAVDCLLQCISVCLHRGHCA